MIQFAERTWLLLLPVALPVLGFLMWRTYRMRRNLLAAFVARSRIPELMPSFSRGRQITKHVLVLLALSFLILALARPQWGNDWQETRSRGIDILFAIDASKSMLAEDVTPSRLERSRLAVLDLVEELSGDRLGLIAFSGNAFLQCPLTLDYDAFRQSLDVVEPGLLARGGSNIASAIQEAAATFEEDDNFKFLILITDGEDLAESGIAEARRAAEDNIRIFTVGVGSETGVPIPIRTSRGRLDYLRDSSGKIVRTRLDASRLREIAEATGGFYVPLGATGEGLNQVYQAGLSSVPRKELDSRLERVPVERFQILLALAILCLVLNAMIGNRKPDKTLRKPRKPLPASATGTLLAFLLGFVGLTLPAPLEALTGNARGLEAFNQGQFKSAESEFRKLLEEEPSDPRHPYNLGNALYKQERYQEAERAFQQALRAGDLSLQATVFYNLGNTYFKLGQQALQSDPQETVQLWEDALRQYQNTLELRPGDPEASHNYDAVKKMVEQLQQQQQNQQNQQNQSQDQNQEQQQQQQQQDQQNPQQQDGNQQEQQQQQGDSRQQQNEQPQDGQEQQQQDPGETMNQQQPQTQENPGEEGRRPLNEREIQAADPGQSGEQDSQQQPQGAMARPLQMSQQEARQLLEALRQSEKKLPISGFGTEAEPQDPANVQDW